MTGVFVYGMLLPEARRSATLPGYRLAFNRHATIVPDPDGCVHGGIIECDERSLWRLDAMEGVDPEDPTNGRGYYRREKVIVRTGGVREEVWVYVMNAGAGTEPPTAGYVAMIRRGYELFGYPTDDLDAAAAANVREFVPEPY